MLTESWNGLTVLYVSPIRALLNNQEQRLGATFNWSEDGRLAGTATRRRARNAASWPNRPTACSRRPSPWKSCWFRRRSTIARFFQNVRTVVIDELHAFAGDDRGWHLLSVLARIQRLAGRDIQRIGLSATVGNPDEMLAWLSSGPQDAGRLFHRPRAKQSPDVQLDYVGSLANAAKVIRLLHQGEKRLVFCDSRSRVEQLALLLREHGIETFVSHSSLGLDERRQAEQAFAQRQNCVIVATSSLELGLDVGDLDRVIQIDAPPTVSSFLQRMGRTGRRPHTTPNCLFWRRPTRGLFVPPPCWS